MNTSIPGIVESYNGKVAKVRPAVHMLMANGDYLKPPAILNVPVGQLYASGGDAIISIPYKKGDHVWIHFSQRSIDEWKKNGDGHPKDPRQFDMTDAYITPVMHPSKRALSTDSIVIQYKRNKIEIGNDITVHGTLKVTGDVVARSNTTRISLSTHTHPVSGSSTGTPV